MAGCVPDKVKTYAHIWDEIKEWSYLESGNFCFEDGLLTHCLCYNFHDVEFDKDGNPTKYKPCARCARCPELSSLSVIFQV